MSQSNGYTESEEIVEKHLIITCVNTLKSAVTKVEDKKRVWLETTVETDIKSLSLVMTRNNMHISVK